jgi:hypothetical protein
LRIAPIRPEAIIPTITSEITVKMSKPESTATEIVIVAKNAQKASPKPSSAVRVVGPKVTDLGGELGLGLASPVREQLDRSQPEEEAADVGEVGDPAAATDVDRDLTERRDELEHEPDTQ